MNRYTKLWCDLSYDFLIDAFYDKQINIELAGSLHILTFL